jgi:hypothetical protein
VSHITLSELISRQGQLGVYWFAAGKAKWKFQLNIYQTIYC